MIVLTSTLEPLSERFGRLAPWVLAFLVGPLAGPIAGGLAGSALGVACAADQVSDDDSDSGCGSFAPVASATGSILAWQSDCSPTGANADASTEIFRATVGTAAAQLTSGTGCASTNPTISDDGSRVAFESSCNLTGGNTDANVEIFLWKSSGGLFQLTTTVACDNFAPSINGAGTFVAYDSNCITATNVDGSFEIFRVSHTGTIKQLTRQDSGTCDSTSASIDASGSLVAFDSDCDLTGENEDLAVEIFTVTSDGAVDQRTVGLDDSCSSLRPSMDGAGSIIAFQSDCDFAGTNPDRGDEIFTVAGSATPHQVTSVADGVECASGEPHMASSGKALTFSGYCKLNGSNSDGSVEVFHVGAGTFAGGILAVTVDGDCSSVGGGIDASGTLVVFDSDCDPTGGNGDGSVEVYRSSRTCVCGGPSTRKTPPKAADALFVLRAAVGISGCAACECDVDNSGGVAAADALRILKKAVGQTITLTCP